MTLMNEILTPMALFGTWVQSADGTNIVAALICIAALLGAGPRLCLVATLVVHLVLIAL